MGDDATDDVFPEFDPTIEGPAYLYERLADYLGEMITKSRFRLHQRFPGEQQLARTYGVALGTARHATSLLRARGLVTTVKSKGTYVTYDIETGSAESPPNDDRWSPGDAQSSPPDTAHGRSQTW
ncbi:winged helix-turn-helix transcriptional regulator [Amycolatopsis acidiphila]|uniref:Winged helix-turn-helix transcriptional regulator n=2 Tax=Amycolatopsis acidiphila TaxID=715473 RepID=A0A558A3X7_9PSEU|nr:winged helix-turn-helix transcriptional regulator [Amycolatopsis acidiphila]